MSNSRPLGKPKTHGLSRTPIYMIWAGMKQRCLNPKAPNYANYGGRGIKICAEWINDFAAFHKYVGKRPSPDHEIDRYPDNDGNYEPGNIRWATRAQQRRNMRGNVLVDGEIAIDVAARNGIGPDALYFRLRMGMDIHAATTTPVRQRRSNRKDG